MVVESVSMVRSMSMVSMIPAALEVISRLKSSPSVTISHVVELLVMSALLGLTLVPEYVFTAAPKISCATVSVMVCVVVVVALTVAEVKRGEICCAVAGAAASRTARARKRFI